MFPSAKTVLQLRREVQAMLVGLSLHEIPPKSFLERPYLLMDGLRPEIYVLTRHQRLTGWLMLSCIPQETQGINI